MARPKRTRHKRKVSTRETSVDIDGATVRQAMTAAAPMAQAAASAAAAHRRRKRDIRAAFAADLRRIEDEHDIMFTKVRFKDRPSAARG